MGNAKLTSIRQILDNYSANLESAVLFPTVVPDAAYLIAEDPYAFAIGVCLDRGTKADIIWTIPYDIKNCLGHLDPKRIYTMSLGELDTLFRQLPRRPRYMHDAPRTLHELTRIVVEECQGDAAGIWQGKRAAEVNRTFRSIHGVGEGIANMGVLLIEASYKIRFDDLDHARMDIKPDVHTMRVLYRLGVSQEIEQQAAIQAARTLSPEYPGAVDGALWWLGRERCHSRQPKCRQCLLDEVCVKVGVE